MAARGRGAVWRGGLGARRVEPDGGRARTPLTAQLGLGLRPGRYTAVSLGYSRTPFDETAGLMQQDLTVDAVDLSFDISPGPGWSLSGGGGGAWFSDQRSEEHTSELQSQSNLVCRLLLEKKKKTPEQPLPTY